MNQTATVMHKDELATPQQIPDLELQPSCAGLSNPGRGSSSRLNKTLETLLATLHINLL